MSGSGALTQNGSGTLTLSGANTFTGQTTISTGTLQIGAGSTTGKLSASSVIVNNSNLTINRSNAVTQGTDFSSAAITGTGSLTAAGAGTTTLNAANSYSGGTTVNAGADLRINGAQTGAGMVTVAATGKLGGSGSVIGGINVSGILSPGNSIESLGGGALNFAAGSTYAYELSTLGLNGDLTYSSGALSIAAGTILTLTDLATSTALANGSKLTLISSVGAWNGGLFSYDAGAGLATLADDSNITLGANIWKINYNDTLAGSNFISDTTGATNFVTLTVVPEPNAAALLGGLGTLLLLRRRR
jgi:autotransporter-associated beta strand protein